MSALTAVYQLELKRYLRGRKLWIALVAALCVVLVGIAVRYGLKTDNPVDATQKLFALGWRMLVFLLSFLFASGAVSDEVEARTIAYLTLRPVNRIVLLLGKYLAACSVTVAILVSSVLIAHIACFAASPSELVDKLKDTARVAGVMAYLSFGMCAICLMWSTLVSDAAGILATFHLVVLEFGLAFVPVMQLATLNFHARLLADPDAAATASSLSIIPGAPVSLAVMGVMSLLYLGVAALVFASSEYHWGRA